MSGKDLIVTALPGFILGWVLFFGGGLFGSMLGRGWQDFLQGSAFFIGLIWAVIAVRRKSQAPRR